MEWSKRPQELQNFKPCVLNPSLLELRYSNIYLKKICQLFDSQDDRGVLLAIINEILQYGRLTYI